MNADAMHSISGALRRQVKLHGAGNTQTRMFRCSPPVTLRLSWSPWMRLRDSLVSQCRLRATIISSSMSKSSLLPPSVASIVLRMTRRISRLSSALMEAKMSREGLLAATSNTVAAARFSRGLESLNLTAMGSPLAMRKALDSPGELT